MDKNIKKQLPIVIIASLFIALIFLFLIKVFQPFTPTDSESEILYDADIVFSCTQSVDGLCFTMETLHGDTCYTSTGKSLGDCKVSDYLYPKTDYYICRTKDTACPTMYTQAYIKSTFNRYYVPFTFSLKDNNEELTGFCVKEKCYSYSGTFYDDQVTLFRKADLIRRCFPIRDNHCPIVPAMIRNG